MSKDVVDAEGGTAPLTFDAARVHEPLIATLLAFIAWVGAVLALLAWTTRHAGGRGLSSVALAMAVVLVGGLVALRFARERLRPVRVEVTREALRMGDARPVPLDMVRVVGMTAAHGGVVLALRKGRWVERLWVATRDEADALRERLTPPSGVREYPYEGSPVLFILAAGVATGLLAYVFVGRLPAGCATFPGTLLSTTVTAFRPWRRKLVVGADGIRIEGFRRSQVIAFADVLGFQRRGRAVFLRVRPGRIVRIPDAVILNSHGERIGYVIENARAAWRGRMRDGAEESILRRVDAATTTQADAGPRYRIAAFPRERLLELVEDVGEDLAQRTAAAEALAGDEDEATRARLEAVALASVSPELRRAARRAR